MTSKKFNIAIDLIFIMAFASVLNVFATKISISYAGPITAFSTLILVAILMHFRGNKWATIGLRKPPSWLKLVGQVLLVLVGTILVGALVSKGLGSLLGAPEVDRSRFEAIEGNLMMFLWWALVGWVVGGFAEEMIFRGFLLNRVEALLADKRFATVFAVLFQAFFFGLIHFYNRGLVPALTIAAVAITLAAFYLRFGRNLWPLILAHGTIDTLSFLEDYLGA